MSVSSDYCSSWTGAPSSASSSPPRSRGSTPRSRRHRARGSRPAEVYEYRWVHPRPTARFADNAVRIACSRGDFALLDMVSDPAGKVVFGRNMLREALLDAARTGDVRVVDRLSFSPFFLDHSDVMAGAGAAFRIACRNGWHGVVERFGLPPYSVTKSDALAFGGVALLEACEGTNPELIRVLHDDPYLIARGDVNFEAIESAVRDSQVLAAVHHNFG